uniref:ABC transporter permease subunit n=1 Tax=Escherichia coli TaxID=562 RepID=UPI003D9BF903
CFVFVCWWLNKSIFSRHTVVIGWYEEAARLVVVAVVRAKIISFALAGLVSALVGIVLGARVTSWRASTAICYELSVISACV